ncbi:hypothetical protein N5C46_17430 [Rossellomorea vietnamensis]|uniref:Uncharacterized protein n=1 Tax=Rossellomorea vietnamensis TaxID=218284 RepID=A0ACD4C464_9BACI|nr:hypothetical protein [Rossellomorea vietnamensis]UXH43431.1 hypothetical protein N5C46_17430 [Rossellomorea vietnamensis]
MSHNELVLETIESLEEYLPKVANEAIIIAELLRKDKESEAMDRIQKVISAIEWVVSAINGIKGVDFPLNIDTYEINEYLFEIQDGLHFNDTVLIADIFEYEINPAMLKWLERLEKDK